MVYIKKAFMVFNITFIFLHLNATLNQVIKYRFQIYFKKLKYRMKLEPIIQSEVSQKEKHQYSILTHIYGI